MFSNRVEAGRRLAGVLAPYRADHPVVVGLPRGGVPVAAEVAAALDAPLDVIVVRKLGLLFQRELAMGAVGEGGVLVLNDDVVRIGHVTEHELTKVEELERAEVERRARRFRSGASRTPLTGRTVIVVDDGIATGSTARAACRVARALGAAKIVLAVPVAPRDWIARLGNDADEYVCVSTPEPFHAVGQFYRDFAQTTDDEVIDCLRAARQTAAPADVVGDPPSAIDHEIDVDPEGIALPGHLSVPASAVGIVVFVHGSGSSRHSPRNRFVATELNAAGLGTLLFDLLRPREELVRANVFDIDLLAARLTSATQWLRAQPQLRSLPVGYFGASTGAAAALWAAAEPGNAIAAVVSRGGRPDLAAARLATVQAPTLLIVGGHDEFVLELNRQAQAGLRCENELEIVPGATHLFEEPGTLAVVARLARDWFLRQFQRVSAS